MKINVPHTGLVGVDKAATYLGVSVRQVRRFSEEGFLEPVIFEHGCRTTHKFKFPDLERLLMFREARAAGKRIKELSDVRGRKGATQE